jgi:hypothetical protein
MKFLPPCTTLAGMRQVSYTITLIITPSEDLVGNRRRKNTRFFGDLPTNKENVFNPF